MTAWRLCGIAVTSIVITSLVWMLIGYVGLAQGDASALHRHVWVLLLGLSIPLMLAVDRVAALERELARAKERCP